MSAAPRPDPEAELRLARSLDAAPRALPAAESERAEDRKPHGPPQLMPPPHSMRGLRRVMLACAGGSAAIGGLGLFAWHTAIVDLLTWHAGFTALHYNTALLLVLAGAALAALARNRRLLAGGMALLVACSAGLIAGNELFSLHLGLNTILFSHAAVATRVAPNTALALLVAGIGLFLTTIPMRWMWRGAAISGLGSVVTIMATVSLLGYAFAVSAAYRWREYNAMSLPAAVGLALLGVGLLVAGRLQTKWHQAQGPQPLTVTLAIALAAASLLLWQALDWQRDLADPESILPEITLAAALLVSALAVAATWLAQLARQRSRELQRSGKAVLAERQRLHAVMDMLPAYVVLISPDYLVPFANRFFEERFGKSEGRRCYEYLFQRDAPCENCETFTVVRTRSPHHWEWVGPDGRNYDISDFPFSDSDGSPLIMEVGLDVTEQKAAERKLRGLEFYSRSLLEASLDPLVTISRQGKITDVNQAAEAVTGMTRAQLIGSDFSDYFSEPEKARAGYQKVFADGSVKDYPLTIRHLDGRLTEVLYNATLYRNRAGEVEGVFAAARDITELKRAEQQLHDYASELERSNAELQDFAAIASHDLQEPLRKVLAFGDRLKEHSGPALDDTGLDFLRRMQNAAARMSLLIQSLLQYSRVATRAQPFESVDLTQVMIEVLADLDLSIRTAKAKVAFDVLPIVSADRLQMRQLLQNLVANALKFQPGCRLSAVGPRQDQPESPPLIAETPPPPTDGHRPEVVIEAAVQDGLCTLRVCDNGIGFEETYLDRIFRPFQRLHGRQEYPGSGMGLAICRKIVQRHGGNITAHSKLGNGSTFEVTLPLGSGQWPVVSGQQDVASRSVLTTGH